MAIKPRKEAPQREVDLSPAPGDQIVAADGWVYTRRVAYNGEPVEQREKIRVPIFNKDPARVRVSGGVTQNMGDYNSARVDVMVELPCLPEVSEIDRAYHTASQMVDGFLTRELNMATGNTNGQN